MSSLSHGEPGGVLVRQQVLRRGSGFVKLILPVFTPLKVCLDHVHTQMCDDWQREGGLSFPAVPVNAEGFREEMFFGLMWMNRVLRVTFLLTTVYRRPVKDLVTRPSIRLADKFLNFCSAPVETHPRLKQ